MVKAFIFSSIKDIDEKSNLKKWNTEFTCKESTYEYSYDYKSKHETLITVGNKMFFDKQEFCIIIGTISNIEFLREKIQFNDEYDTESIIICLYNMYGLECFRMISGSYVCFIKSKTKYVFASGKTSGPCLYYKINSINERVLVTSELKCIPKEDRIMTDFHKLTVDKMYGNKSITNLNDVKKVIPGHCIEIDFEKQICRDVEYFMPNGSITIFDEEEAKYEIRKALESYIDKINVNKITSLISGGVDSSIITYLASKKINDMELYTIGTEDNNEFDFANMFAKSIGYSAKELLFSEENFLDSYVEIIKLVEHSHSVFLEYLVPIQIAHSKLSSEKRKIISGYGSDILFAGFAQKNMNIQNISQLVWNEYISTFWSNETSQNLADNYGFEVFYPYFDDKLVELSFKIDPSLKFKNKIEKYILRYSYKEDIISDIIWRKKVGVHQGTGCEDYFTKLLNISELNKENRERVKDYFAYKIFEALFVNKELVDNDYLKFLDMGIRYDI